MACDMKSITDEELAWLTTPLEFVICLQCHLVENQTDSRKTNGAEQSKGVVCQVPLWERFTLHVESFYITFFFFTRLSNTQYSA